MVLVGWRPTTRSWNYSHGLFGILLSPFFHRKNEKGGFLVGKRESSAIVNHVLALFLTEFRAHWCHLWIVMLAKCKQTVGKCASSGCSRDRCSTMRKCLNDDERVAQKWVNGRWYVLQFSPPPLCPPWEKSLVGWGSLSPSPLATWYLPPPPII